MNIAFENKSEKISRTLVLLILVSMITYSLYNVFNYKTTTYYKSIEGIQLVKPIMQSMEDSSSYYP